MAKKRNRRRNGQERAYHERAVALRKMTDEQLVKHFDRNYQAGLDAGRLDYARIVASVLPSFGDFMQGISSTRDIDATALEESNDRSVTF